MPIVRSILRLVLVALTTLFRDSDDGLPPEEAIKTFELHPGFQIELLAAEPLVADPTSVSARPSRPFLR